MALIRTLLEYSSAVFYGASQTHLKKLDVIQKMAARVICGVPRDAHAGPLLEELGLDLLANRRTRHMHDLISGCITEKIHPAVKELIHLDVDDDVNCVAQCVPKSVIGNRAFSAIGQRLYLRTI